MECAFESGNKANTTVEGRVDFSFLFKCISLYSFICQYSIWFSPNKSKQISVNLLVHLSVKIAVTDGSL
jgi:hypothetical protein